ncbi:Predicted amidohydrolase [Flavobacterium segetis]|uniref:Predicted amidohydrolase n=1 Tax=Flavobacterium segetis TaxID=271157 RepID=A0A1M5IFV2_9FLAO|nr:nitrilase-related carbon-nitrogen hydrolase [Flavobacterium segetis]SHG27171.1 Predicted amidohydrolase [Flavobacterium segetis]
MRVAIVSLNSVWEDKSANLIAVENAIKSIGSNAAYVIFPEMSLTGFSVTNLALAEDFENSNSIQILQKLAEKYKINIIFGLMISREKNTYNSCIAINKKGNIDACYEKMHLFSFSGEHKLITSGDEIKSLPWHGGWGLTICFDLRFPELYQELSKENLILINIANWPKARVSHWRTLLNARAIENQSFMIGVNRTGTDGKGLEYEESSCVFSPLGEMLNPVMAMDDVKIFEINTEEATAYRMKFPIKDDRRGNIYQEFFN